VTEEKRSFEFNIILIFFSNFPLFLIMNVAVIGLGYVGLPLAVELGKHYDVVGFDINSKRVKELQAGFDRTGEASSEQIQSSKGIRFSDTLDAIASCNFYIVTVPTPIDQFKAPDLKPLLKASAMLGSILKKGDIVVYESTVYPGCTEEDCVPVLENTSGLQFNKDFFCGYSPERINPGDKINTLSKIKKVTSGSTPDVAKKINDVYASIITAGTFMASSIRVAEASKAIENAQRDVNISFVNELALIFDRMGIDTQEVLAAASTKWNFLPYKPGLVGGHCIGVDPYYLAHKAQALGYHPQVILSGRRVNDTMGLFIANKTVKLMIQKGIAVKGAKALVLGITFKENCPDIRNTRVVDIIDELKQFGMQLDVYDPHANADEVEEEYNITLCNELANNYNALIVCVAHQEFKELQFNKLLAANAVVFDTKAIWNKEEVDARL
jgi:UDP-N-acetyl-D-galactosamine dehydrogenase